jgi:hypothetical protein
VLQAARIKLKPRITVPPRTAALFIFHLERLNLRESNDCF